ncbi:DUF2085 domain-containing protein [Neobacillus sp. GCM10023253]|uniref:DUF2085 domain-containing protein n=1 Tax=Neobacillus sp. GCM10023253 TaxID=3252644 RepID=UPI00360C550F
MDFFGRAICHQIDERSLHVSGKALSVCARDTGIYIGIFSTLIYLHLVKSKTPVTIPTVKMSFFLLVFMVPLVVDGLGSYSHLFESTNTRRLVTGICFGSVLPYFVYPVVKGESLEQTSQPVVKNFSNLILPMLFSLCLGLLIYWGILPYSIINGLLVLIIIIWFSLCASILFSSVRFLILKWTLSVFSSLIFLTFLSLLHELVIS